jgi:hypothetical protein
MERFPTPATPRHVSRPFYPVGAMTDERTDGVGDEIANRGSWIDSIIACLRRMNVDHEAPGRFVKFLRVQHSTDWNQQVVKIQPQQHCDEYVTRNDRGKHHHSGPSRMNWSQNHVIQQYHNQGPYDGQYVSGQLRATHPNPGILTTEALMVAGMSTAN